MSQTYSIEFRAMGCSASVWLESDQNGEAILRCVPAQIEAIEAVLSRFRPTSELSRLNARSGAWVEVSDLLLQVVLAAKHAARVTDGFCNPLILPALLAIGYDRSFDQLDSDVQTRPAPVVPDWRALEIDVRRSAARLPEGGGLDLGGIGKGWTAEYIAEQLSTYGSCLVDLGGDIVVRGRTWPIEVTEPGTDDASVLSISLSNAAVATSGTDYRRWQTTSGVVHHLIDPRTGRPAQTDVITATVVHPRGTMAEAYAKAILLMGSERGLHWMQYQWLGDAMIVRADGAVLATPNFSAYVLRQENAT